MLRQCAVAGRLIDWNELSTGGRSLLVLCECPRLAVDTLATMRKQVIGCGPLAWSSSFLTLGMAPHSVQSTLSSDALNSLSNGLGAVDNVLSFAKPTKGKPSNQERSLFVASVALSYAVWENFVEDLVIEATRFLAMEIDPASVPEPARRFVEHNTKAWDLSVHPGWRDLWIDRIKTRAKGREDEDEDFGLLTASAAKVKALFANSGLDPFAGVDDDLTAQLDDLVALRGEIVHTGQAPSDFYKANAISAKDTVQQLSVATDASIAEQVDELAGKRPW